MMRARALAEVLLKVWAITLLVQALFAVPQALGVLFVAASPGTVMSTWQIGGTSLLVSAGLLLIAALLVFAFAQKLASFIARADDKVESSESSLQTVAFGTLGLYFAVLGLRQLGGLAFELVVRPEWETERVSYLWQNSPRTVVEAAVQTVCGFALLLGRRGLSRAVQSLRGSPADVVD